MSKVALSFITIMIAGLLSMMPATFAQTLFETSSSTDNTAKSNAGSMSPSEFVGLVTQLNQQIITNLTQQAAQLLQGAGATPGSSSQGSSTGSPPPPSQSSSPPSNSSSSYTGWGSGSGTGTPPPPQGQSKGLGVPY